MSKFALLVVVAALGFGTPASSQDLPSFEFRGHKIGEDARVTFPNFDYVHTPCATDKVTYQYVCPDDEKGLPPCYPMRERTDQFECSDTTIAEKDGKKYLGDVEIAHLRYRIFDGKMYAIEMMINSRDFVTIGDMLIGKYGVPSNLNQNRLTNGYGAQFVGLVYEWKFKEGTLILKEKAGSNHYGNLVFENPAATAAIDAKYSATAQAKGKEAF